jgi:hypothetical protein
MVLDGVETADDLLDDGIDPPPVDDAGDGGDGGDGQERWVTVMTFWQPAEAHIARLRLEAEDIPCVIVDENMVAANWLWASALGGIKLQVPLGDAAQARQLLAPHSSSPGHDGSGEPLFDGQRRCPRCGSVDISSRRFSRKLSFLSVLLLGFPVPFFANRRKRCGDCRFEWTGG